MAEITPAILPKDFAEIEDKLSRVKGIARTVQIDICDGMFVKSKTWPYTGEEHIFEEIVSQDRGMPFWEDFDFEFDLMIQNPYQKMEEYVSLGAKRIVVHMDSLDQKELEAVLRDFGKRSDALGPFGIELGIAIGSRADVTKLDPYMNDISFVQVMGIEHIGFQKQSFDESALQTIKALRHRFPDILISIDGGVSVENAPLLIEAGADRLVVGSALFGAPNIVGTMDTLRSI